MSLESMDTLLQFREHILSQIESCLKEVSCQQKADSMIVEIRSDGVDKLMKLFLNHRKGEDSTKGKLFDSILIQKLRDTQQHIILDSYSNFEDTNKSLLACQEKSASNQIVNLAEKFYRFLFTIFQEGIIDLSIIYLCVEDLFQSIKTEDYSKLFFVLEDVIYKHNKGDEKIFLPLLRICNGILNKLSTTNHTNFIGRIHKLIADVFPLSHRSGVNFKGIYNQRFAIEPTNEDVQMQEDEVTACIKTEENIASLSYSFYKNFWLIQKYISDPFKLFKSEENNDFKDYLNEEDNEDSDLQNEDSRSHHSQPSEESTKIFSRFLKMIEKVLDIFEKNPLCENNESDLIEKKYPKYLAKYKLINLQFNDFQFRETFMIQILILFQSLRQPINEKQTKFFKIPSKKRLNKIKNRIIQIFNNILPQEQKEKQDKEDCDKDSESSNPDENKNTTQNQNDSRLTKGINQVLAADNYWSNWKQNKCKPYERNPSKSFVSEIKRARDASLKKLSSMNEFKEGNKQEIVSIDGKRKSKYLSKFGYRTKPLTNKCSSGVMMGTPVLVDNKRSRSIHKYIKINEVEPCHYKIPTIGTMLEKVYCDMDPEEGVDEEYKSTHDKVFTWQLLRSIADNDLTKFMNRDYNIEQLSLEYLAAPYGLKELNYFVRSKQPEEPEVVEEVPVKKDIESPTDGEIKEKVDKSEPRTDVKEKEQRENSSSKADDTKSNRESIKPSSKEERKEIKEENRMDSKQKYKDKEKEKDRVKDKDHKSEKHGREKGEYKESSYSHNLQDSRDARDTRDVKDAKDAKEVREDTHKDSKDSKKEQRYSRQFESDRGRDLNSDHRYNDNKAYDDNLASQSAKRKPEKEITERKKIERRNINNQDFDDQKQNDKDMDYEKTPKNERDNKRDSNYDRQKETKDKKQENEQRVEKTPRENQILPNDFKPTKPIKIDKKIKDERSQKDLGNQREKVEIQNAKINDSKQSSSKDNRREDYKGTKSNKYFDSSNKPRDKERDQRTEHDYKQSNISNRAKEGYESKHSGTDRRDDKFSNEQRNKYGDRNYRDDKR